MSSVLVAEGNADIRDVMARIFARAGHHVVAVVDGLDAWDEACRSLPDLVVLDVSLPCMSGLDVCRALRGGPTTGGVATLIVFTWALNADVLAGLDAGADDYLGKPFDNAALLAGCHAAIERHAVVRDPGPLQPPGEPAAV